MITVKLFGTLRLDSGIREFRTDADTVRAIYPLIFHEILRMKPDSNIREKDLHSCLISVNGRIVRPHTRLKDGDVVYLFPSVAGG